MVQLDRNIPREFEDSVLHVGIYNRITRVISAADAEHDANFGKYLNHKKRNMILSLSFSFSLSNKYSIDRHFAMPYAIPGYRA